MSNGVLNGISKKSFFKGFLTRGGSSKNEQAVNKSLNGANPSQGGNSGSMIGMGTSHLNLSNMNMQTTGMNMMRDSKLNGGLHKSETTGVVGCKDSKQQIGGTTRSFSGQVNRTFGKDITNKVLNSSGAAVIGTNKSGSQTLKNRNPTVASMSMNVTRKPSPSCNSNY